MLTSTLARLNFLGRRRQRRRLEEHRQVLVSHLNFIEEKMASEMMEIAFHTGAIKRRIDELHEDGRLTRQALIEIDRQSMICEEAVFKRLEIRQLCDRIERMIRTQSTVSFLFLTSDLSLPLSQRWTSYLGTLTKEIEDKQSGDRQNVLFSLSVLQGDLIELSVLQPHCRAAVNSAPINVPKGKIVPLSTSYSFMDFFKF